MITPIDLILVSLVGFGVGAFVCYTVLLRDGWIRNWKEREKAQDEEDENKT